MILQNDGYSCATTSLSMTMFGVNQVLVLKMLQKNMVMTCIWTNECFKIFWIYNYEFVDNLKVDELKYLITQDIPVVVNIRNFFQEFSHAVTVIGYNKKGFPINDPANWQDEKTHHIDYETFKNHWWANLCSPIRGKHYNSAFILYKNKK
jgi:hypothetical protein